MKHFMIAYISPTYGLLMTQLDVPQHNNHVITWREVQQALLKEGETLESTTEIYNNTNWEIKEIKL